VNWLDHGFGDTVVFVRATLRTDDVVKAFVGGGEKVLEIITYDKQAYISNVRFKFEKSHCDLLYIYGYM